MQKPDVGGGTRFSHQIGKQNSGQPEVKLTTSRKTDYMQNLTNLMVVQCTVHIKRWKKNNKYENFRRK
jgi:hypothetical protein